MDDKILVKKTCSRSPLRTLSSTADRIDAVKCSAVTVPINTESCFCWGHPYGGQGIMKQGVFKVYPVSSPQAHYQNSTFS